ncbi:MAG: hypothetical protein ABIZ80_14240, partial [Bryobacteraceae bacterium]
MLLNVFFFVLAFATVAALAWSAIQLLQPQETPLADRLEELQSNAMVATTRAPRRRAGGGFINGFLYSISL